MCVTAIIAAGVAIAAAGAGAYASIQTANDNKALAKYEAKEQMRQLYREREAARIASLEKENQRADEFQQKRSSAFAAIGASGLGEHLSFFQSIDPNAQKAYLRDVGTVRLNMVQTEASLADQVGLAEVKKKVAINNAAMSKVSAISDFIQTAMGAVSYYNQMKAPAPAGGH